MGERSCHQLIPRGPGRCAMHALKPAPAALALPIHSAHDSRNQNYACSTRRRRRWASRGSLVDSEDGTRNQPSSINSLPYNLHLSFPLSLPIQPQHV
jgi:hypothetical protein